MLNFPGANVNFTEDIPRFSYEILLDLIGDNVIFWELMWIFLEKYS